MIKTHEITFDKANREIRINGQYAGFIDGSETLDYETVEDEQGLKIIVRETVKLHSPLPDGRKEIVCTLMIIRPYVCEERAAEKRARDKAYKKEREAIKNAYPFKLVEVKENDGQAKMGEFP